MRISFLARASSDEAEGDGILKQRVHIAEQVKFKAIEKGSPCRAYRRPGIPCAFALPGSGDGRTIRAFSLVEVVFALAVFSFALLLIIATIGEGLSNDHDSTNRLQAGNLASLLIATRRAAPTNTDLTNFALPALGGTNAAGQDVVNAVTGYAKVQTDGTINPGTTTSTQVVYNFRYVITPAGSQNNIANVDLVLWWPSTLPALASSMPVNNPANYYELMTQIVLP